jgi:hypothetical protein
MPDETGTWQYRLIDALKGNRTLTGAMAIAIIGKMPSHPPRIVTQSIVTKEGILVVCLEARGSEGIPDWVPLGPVDKIRDEFRRICDRLAFSDAEHVEFFDGFKKWIRKDWRQPDPVLN